MSGAAITTLLRRREGGLRGAVLAETGTPISSRRILQLCLGAMWLLDAALQYQPFMFSRSFVTDIIEPAAGGNPAAVSQSVTWVAHVMIQHIGVYNAAFATVQLVIALGLFYRPTLRPALAASITWALLVWWFGEGLGGVLAGATPLMGEPGGAVIYALISLLVWPRTPVAAGDSPALHGLLGRSGAKALWLALWGSFAWYLLLPANRGPNTLGDAVTAMAPGEPGWIRSIERGIGDAVAHQGTETSIVIAAICALTALAIFHPATVRPAVVAAAIVGLAFWVVQAFGGIFTGTGTDPNSGLPLALLAACYWPLPACARSRPL